MDSNNSYVYGPFIPFTSGTVGSLSGQGRTIKKKEPREWEKWLNNPPAFEAPVGKIFWFDILSENEGSD